MLKRFFLPLLLLGSFAYAKGPEQSVPVYNFQKGLDSYHSSLSLPDGYVQDALNVYFDRSAPVEKRKGFTVAFTTGSYAYQSEWTFTDTSNTSWIIVRSSLQITASNLTGSTVKISTVSANDVVNEANAFGFAYFVDPTQGVYYWNGSSTTYVSGSPKGSLIAQFHGRVWVSGAAVPNGNQLYGSKYLDGTTWATGPNPNDPVQLTVGLQDSFDNVTALYPFIDILYTMKRYSVQSLTGFDETNFQTSFITGECGCIDPNSIQTFNAGLYFVSLRGVEYFNGYSCQRISDPVKNFVDGAISAGTFAQQSWVQSTQSDWQAGTISPASSLSTTISPPNLVLSTATGSFTDSTKADFGAGTFINTSSVTNAVVLNTNNSGNITDNSFEGSSATHNYGVNWDTSTCAAGCVAPFQSQSTYHCGTFTPRTGSWMAGYSLESSNNGGAPGTDGITIDVVDATNLSNVFATKTVNTTANACSWGLANITVNAANIGKRFKVKIYKNYGGGYTFTKDSYVLGGNLTFYHVSDNNGTLGSGINFIDDITSGSDTITTGSFTSEIFDTAQSSPTNLVTVTSVAVSSTSNTEPITFALSSSSSTLGPWTSLTTGNLSSPVLANRYFQYSTTFTVNSADNVFSTLNSFSVVWQSSKSSGTWKSPVHSIGSATSFGNFAVQDTLNTGGNIAFSLCVSTNANMNPGTCGNQTPNTQIALSTGTGGSGTFVQWYSTFSVNAATQVPNLQSGTVQWYSGNKSVPMASTIWDNRYWLSLTTNTADSNNDAILVANKDNVWTRFNINSGGLVQYKNNLYSADATATGNVYLMDQGYADNGSAINGYIKTKDYCNNDLTMDDFLTSIWPSMDNLGNYNVSVNYFTDRQSTAFSLGNINQTEFSGAPSVKMMVPFDNNHQTFARCYAYSFTASDLNEPWSFYGFRQIFHSRPTQ